MQKTYYDALKVLRPYLIRHVKNDAAKLISAGRKDSVNSADEFDSSLPLVFEDMAKVLKHDLCVASGVSPDQVPDGLEAIAQLVPEEEHAAIKALAGSVNYEYHSLLNFELFGRKTFLISDALTQELAQISTNVRCDLLHLPFPTCQVVFTSAVAVNALVMLTGRDIDDLSVMHPGISYDIPISVFLTLLEPNKTYPQRRLIINVWQANADRQRMMAKRQLYLDEDWSLERALHTDWKAIDTSLGIERDDSGLIGRRISAVSQEEEVLDDAAFYGDGLLFFRLVLNAILYLTSTEADLIERMCASDEIRKHSAGGKPNAELRRRLRRVAGSLSELPYCEVGFRLSPIVIDHSISTSESTVIGVGGRKIKVRFRVRGHWRAQPCGPGRRDIRPVWVKDHEKGPSAAQVVNRQYVVK